MGTGHSVGIAFAVDLDVFRMALLQFLHSLFNVFHTAFFTHLLGGDIRVEAGAVPIARNWLGGEGDFGAEFFGDTVEQPSGNPEFITHWTSNRLVKTHIVRRGFETYS